MRRMFRRCFSSICLGFGLCAAGLVFGAYAGDHRLGSSWVADVPQVLRRLGSCYRDAAIRSLLREVG